MSGKRHTDELKVEAGKQVSKREHAVAKVARRPGAAAHNLYRRIKEYSMGAPE